MVRSDIKGGVSGNAVINGQLTRSKRTVLPTSRLPCHDGGDYLQRTMNLVALSEKLKGLQHDFLEPVKLRVFKRETVTERRIR